MQFENEFTVAAPVETVWKTLLDVEQVAPCMPGAQVLERTGDDAYKVEIRVKVGPISMRYRGDVEVVERDEAAHTSTMTARAKETRGQGSASARMLMSLAEDGSGTRATIATDLQLSGKAASMGRGVIQDVAAKLVETFAGNLAEMVQGGADRAAAETPAAPTEPPPPSPPDASHAPPEPPPPPPPRSASSDAALPAGKLAASVIAGRLEEPRTLLIAIGGLAVVFGGIGYRLGRR